ncbi:CATRA conflict system CASPASE/TPR repeat-associated protein [Actinoallomurus bryophytorum]|uniref:CATRA conflict system CASPASE/TPR repeat-associated protein n=1 Tax=Actinoallomurus bryophytorum TaxID=1490222 RepID=UPI001154CF18|nr:CATRA conflict system CASPASE/TPR repeat-associated protein [Actinoallomurus bryophytorum]
MTDQELVAHAFALLSGPTQASAEAAVRALWDGCGSHLSTTEEVARTGLPARIPTTLPSGRLGGYVPVAACQDADRRVEVILRRTGDILVLSVLLTDGPTATWTGLDAKLDTVLDGAALLGVARLYLGTTTGAAGPELGRDAAELLGATEEVGQWWHHGVTVSGGLALWDARPRDDGRERRLVVLAPPGAQDELGRCAWAVPGHADMPPLARYLLHVAKIRYQRDVRTRADVSGNAASPATALRNSAVTTARLQAMRQAVHATWENAESALADLGAGADDLGPFGADRDLARWFDRQLVHDIHFTEIQYEKARKMTETGRAELPSATVQVRVPRDERPRLHFLCVADEWFPARGGLSAFNRYLCMALVRAGADVSCLVPRSSTPERDDADAAGVRLVEASAAPGLSERERLLRRPSLPGRTTPDVVVGHGRVTGDVAKAIAEDFYPGTPRLHFVHMHADEVEWHKLDRNDDAGMRAEERSRLELELALGAAGLVAVGPRLFEWLEREPRSRRPPLLLRLDPGFDGPVPADRSGPPGGRPQILMLGRMEDRQVKGLDIAAKGIADAIGLMSPGTEWDLLVRGAPPNGSGPLRESLLGWLGNTPVNVTIYPYSSEFDRITDDLARSSLVLMPSRAEGFGLVGLEAIVAGTPVLVSDRSGLGKLLDDELPREIAARMVVPVTRDDGENARRWGNLISSVMRDRAAAFATAESARLVMAAARPWARAAGELLDAVSP